MTTIQIVSTAVVLCAIMFLPSLAGIQLSSGGEPEKKVGAGVTIPTLQQAIENRFGRPDRTVGEGNSLLAYRLENGDFVTIVLANDKVVGIEHTAKVDLKKVVGEKVSLVGVYNGFVKETKRGRESLFRLNWRLNDVTLIPTTKKPFDVLAERLFVQPSRGDWTPIELFQRSAASLGPHIRLLLLIFVQGTPPPHWRGSLPGGQCQLTAVKVPIKVAQFRLGGN